MRPALPRAAARALLLAVLVLSVAPMAAQARAAVDLPPGTLTDLLAQLAAQAGVSIQADAALLAGVRSSHAVQGPLTGLEALTRLLPGTGLVATEEAPGVFVLRRAANHAAPVAGSTLPSDTATLPVVRVSALRESLGDALGTATQRSASAATRSGRPALAVPQAVTAFGRADLTELGAARLDQVLDYVPGASRQNDFGGTWDNIALRGFAGHEDTGMSLLRNGMQANRGFNAPRDAANVERFEFLRGAVGALYGVAEPSGTLNLVTREAPWTPERAAELSLGRWNATRAVIELGGPLQGERTAWRLTAVGEDKGSFREHVHTRRELLAPTFTWRLAPETTLRYDGEWLRQRAPLDRGVVALNGMVDTVPVTRFFGEPGDGDLTMANTTHQLLLEHALPAPGWHLHAGALARGGTMRGTTTYGHGYGAALHELDADGWLWRQRRWRDFASSDLSVQIDLRGSMTDAGGRQHTLLLGTEAFGFRMRQELLRNPAEGWRDYGVDVHAPRYRADLPATPDALQSTRERQHGLGFYAQDEIALAPAWLLLLGLRHDVFRQTVDNHLTASTQRQSQSALSPRAGLTWLPAPGWAVYGSAGASLRPNIGVDASGAPFDPEKGLSREVGLKWQPTDRALTAGLALFHVTKRNVLVTDPAHIDHSLAAGRVASQGLEAELSHRVAPGWRVRGSAAWLRRALPQFPRASGSALVLHEWALDGGGSASLGLGATHISTRWGDAGSPRLPAYTTARLQAHWQPDATWRLSLQVDNLFDRHYYASAYNSVWVVPGAPRNVTLTGRYTF